MTSTTTSSGLFYSLNSSSAESDAVTEIVCLGSFRKSKNRTGPNPEIPVPLISVSVEANVIQAVAEVTITQVYKNVERQPIEAIYLFPLDCNGAVTKFEVETGNRTIMGIVKKNKDARKCYEDAMKKKQTAVLGSQVKQDIFKVRVGNLRPGSEAKIIIGYTTEVHNEKGTDSIRFFIPTTVATRYVPPESKSEEAREIRNMREQPKSPAPLDIKVNLFLQGPVESIESPTHNIISRPNLQLEGRPNWTMSTVELRGSVTDMDRDFVLLVEPQMRHEPRIYIEKLQDTVAFMAHFIPRFELQDQKVEVIFLLDRSGSMAGSSINLAKQALELFIRSLPANCYFNIVGFGTHSKSLFRIPGKYSEETMQMALDHINDLKADLGGTNILEPVKRVLSSAPKEGHVRQLFVLTDGEVENTEEIIGHVSANAHTTRVFSLGIGASASHHLVQGLAAAGNGTSAFVGYNEPFEDKVLEQLKDALQPSLINTKLIWSGIDNFEEWAAESAIPTSNDPPPYHPRPNEVILDRRLRGPLITETTLNRRYYQSPAKIPPIFNGSQMIVFGIFQNQETLPDGLTIYGESPDGPLILEIKVDLDSTISDTGMIHKLASIKLIREMELELAAIEATRGTCSSRKTASDLVQNITALGVRHGIASKYTSFVAVGTQSKSKFFLPFPCNIHKPMQTRYVPNQIVRSWVAEDSDSSDPDWCGGGGGGSSITVPKGWRPGMTVTIVRDRNAPAPAQIPQKALKPVIAHPQKKPNAVIVQSGSRPGRTKQVARKSTFSFCSWRTSNGTRIPEPNVRKMYFRRDLSKIVPPIWKNDYKAWKPFKNFIPSNRLDEPSTSKSVKEQFVEQNDDGNNLSVEPTSLEPCSKQTARKSTGGLQAGSLQKPLRTISVPNPKRPFIRQVARKRTYALMASDQADQKNNFVCSHSPSDKRLMGFPTVAVHRLPSPKFADRKRSGKPTVIPATLGNSNSASIQSSTGTHSGTAVGNEPGKANVLSTSNAEVERVKLSEILKYQNHDGSFKWSIVLLLKLDIPARAAKRAMNEKRWNQLAWISTLVVIYLENRLESQKHRWDLIAAKTRKWAKAHAPIEDASAMAKKALQLINTASKVD